MTMERTTGPTQEAIMDVYAWHARTLAARLDQVDHRTTVLCCRLVDAMGAQPWPEGEQAKAADQAVLDQAPDLEAQAVEARKVAEACGGLAEALVGSPAPLDPNAPSPQAVLAPVLVRASALEARCAALAKAMARLRGLLTCPPYGWADGAR